MGPVPAPAGACVVIIFANVVNTLRGFAPPPLPFPYPAVVGANTQTRRFIFIPLDIEKLRLLLDARG